jgi:hypothetical protein
MTAQAAQDPSGELDCWCCGRPQSPEDVVHLGVHPEVSVCLGCAHFLHQRARAREDALRPTPASRVRDVVRAARGQVVARRWHESRLIGPGLRRLGRWLP